MSGRRLRVLLSVFFVLAPAVAGVLAASANVDQAVAEPFFTLTYNAGVGGTIQGTTPQTVDAGGSGTQVTAVASAGYRFVDWSDGVAAASRTDGPVTGNLTVTATFIATYAITAVQGANGRISPVGTQIIDSGGSQTYAIAPTTPGYHIADVLVDNVSVGAVPSHTFSNVTAAHTIRASFAIDTFTITPSAGANGSITPSTPQTVDYGGSQTFTISAATAYYVADVLVDGVSVGPVRKYTFSNVTGPHTIGASFAVGVQTRIAISVRKTVVDYGRATVVGGVLYDSRDPLHEVGMGDRPLILQSATSARGPWKDIGRLTTDPSAGNVGACTATVAPTATTYYQLRYTAPSGSDFGSTLSYVVRVGVRPILSVPKAPASARRGRTFTVSGTISPQFAAGGKTVTISVFRIRKGRLVLQKKMLARNANARDGSKYTARLKLSKGKYRLRAATVATAAWAADTSGLSRVLIVR